MSTDTLHIIAEDTIGLHTPDAACAQALATHLLSTGNWLEVVAGLQSVAVRFDLTGTPLDTAISHLKHQAESAPNALPTTGETLTIPARYGGAEGPDLSRLCAEKGLSEADFIALHSAQTYPVEMIGFTPGFAYIGGLSPALSVPRLVRPRPRVQPGSIGISGLHTGIYPLLSPGGWPLIARTDLRLFDPDQNEPFTLKAGMKIRFTPQ